MATVGNIVFETTTGTGTGNLTIAVSPYYRRFSSAFGTGSGNKFYYCIRHQSANEYEVGIGYMSDANTLVRDSVIESSNSNALVGFSAGSKDVVCDLPASIQNKLEGIGGGFPALRYALDTFYSYPAPSPLPAPAAGKVNMGQRSSADTSYEVVFSNTTADGVDVTEFLKAMRCSIVQINRDTDGHYRKYKFFSRQTVSGRTVMSILLFEYSVTQAGLTGDLYFSFSNTGYLYQEQNPTLGGYLQQGSYGISSAGTADNGDVNLSSGGMNINHQPSKRTIYERIMKATTVDDTPTNIKYIDYATNEYPNVATNKGAAVSGIFMARTPSFTEGVYATGSISGFNSITDGEVIVVSSHSGAITLTAATSPGAGQFGLNTPFIGGTAATQSWDVGGANSGTYSVAGTTLNWNDGTAAVQAALDAATINATASGTSATWNVNGSQSAFSVSNIDLAILAGTDIGGTSFTDGDGSTPASQTFNVGGAGAGTYSFNGNTVAWNTDASTLSGLLSGISVSGDPTGFTLTWSDPSSGQSAVGISNIDLQTVTGTTPGGAGFTDGSDDVAATYASDKFKAAFDGAGGVGLTSSVDGSKNTVSFTATTYNSGDNTPIDVSGAANLSASGMSGGVDVVTSVMKAWKVEGFFGYAGNTAPPTFSGGITITSLGGSTGTSGWTLTSDLSTPGELHLVATGDAARALQWSGMINMIYDYN